MSRVEGLSPSITLFEKQRWGKIRELAESSDALPVLRGVLTLIRTDGIFGEADPRAALVEHRVIGARRSIFAVRWNIEASNRLYTNTSNIMRRRGVAFVSKGVGFGVSEDNGLDSLCLTAQDHWYSIKTGRVDVENLLIAVSKAEPIRDLRFGRGSQAGSRRPVVTNTFKWLDPEIPG